MADPTLLPYKGVMPTLGDNVFVVDSARIIGDVVIGDGSSFWFGAVVRGDVNYIRIGQRTNVQDNSVLHVTKDTFPLFVGSDVTVGHSVTLHGCRVNDRCLIGMGATVLDGAEIGEDVIIGAGALVTEHMKIPERSLAVGVPAKVVRELTDDEVARIAGSAVHYIEYARNYGKDG